MIIEGHLDKMTTSLENDVVTYQLPIDQELIQINSLIGNSLKLEFKQKIHCMHCGKQTKTSFGQGYCFTCFNTIPETDECILNPEKCKAHLGISRDMEWSRNHCLSEHVVYLAYSGNLKVGVTRLSQIPTRWMDQGAIQTIRLAKTPNRHIAGVIEVFFKQHYSDKTSWQKMLKTLDQLTVNLLDEKKNAIGIMPAGLKKFVHENNEITFIKYPMQQHPENVSSVNLNKTEIVSGILTGIKGQ